MSAATDNGLPKATHVSGYVYSELPPSLRKKVAASAPQHAGPFRATEGSEGVKGLVPVVSHEFISTKLTQRPITLVNPNKESDRRLAEKDVAKEQRRRQKISNRRRRSGRLVTSELKPVVARAALATSRSLLKGHVSYELLLPLYSLWLGYISEILNMPLRQPGSPAAPSPASVASTSATNMHGGQSSSTSSTSNDGRPASTRASHFQEEFSLSRIQAIQSKLVKADFHGCKIEVTRAKHPSLVGLAGIVAQETENTLRIVTPKSAVKVIPKFNVTFAFVLPLPPDAHGNLKDLRFELNGSNFAFRGADRASKKFKAKGAKGLDY